jgi:outer membrane lipoprotein SlyB
VEQATKSLHPLTWAAGIALIVFSVVGVGAFMGWIPTSLGGADDTAVPSTQAANAAAPAPAPAQAQGRERIATRDRAPARTAARCSDCGVVQSVREVDVKGQGSGLGAVGGAVVGGVLGNQVGGGRGKEVMTVVGAVGGAVAGNEVEKRVKSTKSYQTTVRFDDGTSRAISEPNAPSWRAGDKVRVVNGVIQSNG